MPALVDLSNKKFTRLTVVSRHVEPATNGHVRWVCKCECGNPEPVIVPGYALKNGNTQSCGCLRRELVTEANTSHGMYYTPEYAVWNTMKERCYNEKSGAYADYGGRGIAMCDGWRESFEAFYRDMGPRPSKEHSVDRENNDLGYCKENCRWATRLEQANNTTRNIYYELDGKKKTLAEWCRELVLPYKAVYGRLKRGMTLDDAIADIICS